MNFIFFSLCEYLIGLSYSCDCHVLQITNPKKQITNKSQIPISKLSKVPFERAKFQGILNSKDPGPEDPALSSPQRGGVYLGLQME
ncbi:hypothetical protein D1AOALGA4SA_12345 [Olavius algarvensis Delta 1 endosymbiont]|nr:hypothetical protein D1AOALGA4SA_12345 [Olavius algarvensis Delta 1 endosymbiont]